jgi:Mg-chelatase subunit ChlD
MTFRILALFAGVLAALLQPATTIAQEKCYVDRGVKNPKKNRVCFPMGDISFADKVVSFSPGKPTPHPNYGDPAESLGPPNFNPATALSLKVKQKSTSLGCGGTIVLQFTNNALVDRAGADLYVFEIGGDVEPTRLWISKDGQTWIDIGRIKGATAAIDIKKFVQPGDRFRYVRLTDLKSHCAANWGGADIDAVGAIGTEAAKAPPTAPPKPAFGHLSVSASDQRIAGAAQVVLILDSSGSMRGKMRDGKRRIDVAKRVLVSVVNKLPETVRVGLRVYGHRHKSRPKKRSCRDSELLVPFGPLDRPAIKLAISRLRPRGQTPIGYSLAQLARDFRGRKGAKLVLLVSDGIETCDAKPGSRFNPKQMIARLKKSGVRFRLNVVGLDIGRETARAFLKDIATAGGGRYIDARDNSELDRAIRTALAASFDVIDNTGKTVARGTVGRGRVRLQTGTYTVVIRAEPVIRIARVVVPAGKTKALFVDRKGKAVTVARQVR